MSSTIDAYAWMDQAECRDMDLSSHDPFDPPSGGRYQSFVDEALAICARCNVRDECLTDALQQRDVYGVKGGTTGQQREDILRAPERVKVSEQNRKKYAAQTEEQRQRHRERNRERMARARSQRPEMRAREAEQRRDRSMSKRAAEEAAREAVEVEDVPEVEARDTGVELSVA